MRVRIHPLRAGCEHLTQQRRCSTPFAKAHERVSVRATMNFDASASVDSPAERATDWPTQNGGQKQHRGLSSLRLGGLDVDAVSVGGQETCICVPSLRLVFDIGRCPQRACYLDSLLLTHCHLDHVGGVANYVATRALLGVTPPRVVVPAACAPALERTLAAFRELDGSELPCSVVPVASGDVVPVNKTHTARLFPTLHTVASTGYVIYSHTHKLKLCYAGLPGQDIAALRKAGTEVTDSFQVPLLAFTGDTSGDWVTLPGAEDALSARLLVMECTFVDDAVSVADAIAFGHTHIDQIVAHADRFRNEAILLTHFSARYRRDDIVANLRARLPPHLLQRVTPLLEGFA